MNCAEQDLLLYAVTDRHWLHGRTLHEVVKESLDGGVTFLQLREKDLDEARFLDEAKDIKTLCHAYGVPFLINDNVDIARAVDADGVHVGQSDMEAGDVRAKLGPDKIIGVSAHNVEEAVAAQAAGADYLGAGAAFVTSTKGDARPIPHAMYRAITDAVDIPVVAIGGITEENMAELRGCGLDGVAVVSSLFAAQDVAAAAGRLRALAETL